MVCCSIASWILVLSCSLRLLNSSIQQRPASASTNAPASKFHSPESFTAVTVRPKKRSTLCRLLFSKAHLIPMKGNKYLHFKWKGHSFYFQHTKNEWHQDNYFRCLVTRRSQKNQCSENLTNVECFVTSRSLQIFFLSLVDTLSEWSKRLEGANRSPEIL